MAAGNDPVAGPRLNVLRWRVAAAGAGAGQGRPAVPQRVGNETNIRQNLHQKVKKQTFRTRSH
jgi:hypothetical protein